MTFDQDIVAQISTYPLDARHARCLLKHQVRAWGSMVDRILITVDTHRSNSGRYCGSNFDAQLAQLRRAIEEVRAGNPRVYTVDVDYSQETCRAVARYFFGVDSIAIKAWDGGPYYAYFFGLYAARSRYVAHFDGDMMFGGGSRTWVRDAITCMEQRPDVLMTAPYAGPPRADGAMFAADALHSAREPMTCLAYRHMHVSTRVFLIDLDRFKRRLGTFDALRPAPAQRLKAKLLGNPPDAREAEVVMSESMQRAGLSRIDLLGAAPGMWSLHPPYRSEEFYRRLPELVRAIEAGRVPDSQRGHYDLHDSMVDWSQARADNQWHRRYLRMLRQRLAASP